MECRSRPTGFVEILFGGGAVGWRHFSSEGVTIFCRVKDELKLEDSKQCSRQQCSLRRRRQGSAGLSQLQCIGVRIR